MKLTPVSRRTALGDVLFATVLTGLAVAVHVGGSEAVPANRPVSAWSIALTVLAMAPIAVRRWVPVEVLVLTSASLLVMVATHNVVGLSTLGPVIAFYTAVAYGSQRHLRAAFGVVLAAILVGAVLRPVDLSAEGALINCLVLLGAGVLGAGVRQRRDRYEADMHAAGERAALAAAEERLRITRELHDIVGHALGVMVVQAGVAEELLETRPDEARRAVTEIGATGRASLAEMRQVLGSLRDGGRTSTAMRAPLPSLAQLPELVGRIEAAGLPVALEVRGDVGSLSPGLDLAAYRVVQEALTNVLKHAHARRADVTVEHRGAELLVRVVDDGNGSAAAPTGGGGHGLVGMRERVTVFGGHLVAGPRPGGGFGVEAVLPTTAEPA